MKESRKEGRKDDGRGGEGGRMEDRGTGTTEGRGIKSREGDTVWAGQDTGRE